MPCRVKPGWARHRSKRFIPIVPTLHGISLSRWSHVLPREATWKRGFKLPWREAGPPYHHDDEVDSDQQVVNKKFTFL